MTEKELFKDLLLTFTEGFRVELIKILTNIKNLEEYIDKKLPDNSGEEKEGTQ